MGKNQQKTKEWTDYLSNNVKRLSYSYDLCLRFSSPSTFGGNFVQIAVLWGRAGCPLSGVERCPLLGGSKYTISMGRSIGGMVFVRFTEIVRLSESPLLEVSLYAEERTLVTLHVSIVRTVVRQVRSATGTIHIRLK